MSSIWRRWSSRRSFTELFGLEIKLSEKKRESDTQPAGNVVITEGPHGVISDLDYQTDWDDISKRFDLIEKMRRSDGRCGRTATMIKYPFLQADWWLEAADDSPEAAFVKEAAEWMLFKHLQTPWRTYVLPHALLSLEYGFSIFHKIWDKPVTFTAKDATWHGSKTYTLKPWRKLAFRHPVSIEDRFELGSDGGLNAVRQVTPEKAEETPIKADELIVICPNREGDDWTGISIYRRAYKHFAIKEKLELLQAMAAERYAIPIPVFGVEMANLYTDAWVNQCAAIAKKLRAHEQMYVTVPFGTTIEFPNPGHELPDFTKSINYHNEQISSAMLQEFMDLSQTKSGARAVGQVQDDPFWASLQATAEQIAEPFVQFGLKQWVEVNFPDSQDLVPALKASRIAPTELAALGDGVAKLFQVGALTVTPSTEEHLRRELKWPQITEGERKEADERVQQQVEAEAKAKAAATTAKVDKNTPRVVKASEWKPHRELKGAEQHVDWYGIKGYLDEVRGDINARLRPIRKKMAHAVAERVAKAVGERKVPLAVGVPEKSTYAKVVRAFLDEAYAYGKRQVETEIASQGTYFADDDEDHKEHIAAALSLMKGKVAAADVLAARANSLADTAATQIKTAALRESPRLIAQGVDEEEAVEELEDLLDELSEGDQGKEGEKGIIVAMSLGRAAAAAALLGLAASAQLSAVLDDNTCPLCWDKDGSEVYAAEALTTEPFVYTDCRGSTSCRCIWVYSLL